MQNLKLENGTRQWTKEQSLENFKFNKKSLILIPIEYFYKG